MATTVAERTGEEAKVEKRVAPQEQVVVKVPRGIVATTAEELGAEASGARVDVPQDVMQDVHTYVDNYKAFLAERTELYLKQLAADRQRGAAAEIGAITVGTYTYMDIVSISPIELLPPPFSWQPNKVIGSGELAMILAVLFINPAVAPGPAPPATVQLGGRTCRIRFDQVNLTDVANGPDFQYLVTFPPLAPSISIWPYFFIAPNPGPNPRLMEVNVTADIVDLVQPHAAFGTHHLDIDSEPSFLGLPAVPPQLQHDIPLRYLIFPK